MATIRTVRIRRRIAKYGITWFEAGEVVEATMEYCTALGGRFASVFCPRINARAGLDIDDVDFVPGNSGC